MDHEQNMQTAGYGHRESNTITDEIKRVRDNLAGDAQLDDPRLRRIIRLRLVSDPGFPMWDVSYCYGELKDGTYVRVHLPLHQFSKRRRLKGQLIEMCREAKVFAKGLGFLDPSVVSMME